MFPCEITRVELGQNSTRVTSLDACPLRKSSAQVLWKFIVVLFNILTKSNLIIRNHLNTDSCERQYENITYYVNLNLLCRGYNYWIEFLIDSAQRVPAYFELPNPILKNSFSNIRLIELNCLTNYRHFLILPLIN